MEEINDKEWRKAVKKAARYKGQWVRVFGDGKVRVWFSSLGKYLSFEEWKKMIEEKGKKRFCL